MTIATWVGRIFGAALVAGALSACSNDDTTITGGDGGAGTDSGIVTSGDAGSDGGNGLTTACLSNCPDGHTCTSDSACASGSCSAGLCEDQSCSDGVKDGTETATDCGGTCAPCVDGRTCLAGSDCTSGVCDPASRVCDAPTDMDGVKNGTETDVDCGTSGTGEADSAPACGDGKGCNVAADCVDNQCGANHTCLAATCSDGKKDGTETGTDCGGSCNACADGTACKANADCTSKSCDVNGSHQCLAPTSGDKIQNGNETDTDCGSGGTGENTHAPACVDGKKCDAGTDCLDLVCSPNGVCSSVSCSDHVQNGEETGVDCGGGPTSACVACPDMGGCKADTDCTSKSCDVNGAHLCLAPTSGDGIKNGNETDKDCGHDGTGEPTGAVACPDGEGCATGADCVDKECGTNLKCTPASCSDGVQNGMETAVDCGGTCSGCADTVACKVNTDCASKSCDSNGTKLCLAPTSGDGIANGNETDVDCGSGGKGDGAENTHAAACPDNEKCVSGADCKDLVCGAGACSAPSCGDGVKNGKETGQDCGGGAASGCVACGDGVGCGTGTDCTSLSCNTTSKQCSPPTSTDGLKNGNESDVDCGSSGTGEKTSAPACPDVNLTTNKISVCNAAADCKSTYCNTTRKQCVDGQSCSIPAAAKASIIHDISVQAVTSGKNAADAVGVANTHGAGLLAGIDTCGSVEATDATAGTALESCCRSLDVAIPAENKTIRLDKYEVTAGRMRQFVEAVSAIEGGTYNIQKWVDAQITANTTAGKTMVAQFPTGANGTTDTRTLFPTALTGTLSLAYQLGATSMDDGVPSPYQGCYMGADQYAASTYWFDKADSANAVGSPPRAFTQDYYDVKPQNCVPYWMSVAFCAWDGGAIPTRAEYDHVWGGAQYPWGTNTSRTYRDIGAPPAGTPITSWTIDNLNGDSELPMGESFFYHYPASNGDSAGNPSNPASGPLSFKSIIDTTTDGYDNTPYIAAPGRFVKDVTALTATGVYAGDPWFDIAANLMEFEAISDLTSNANEFCDTSEGISVGGTSCPAPYTCIRNVNVPDVTPSCGYIRGGNMPPVGWNGGSWEVHDVQQDGYGEPMQTQYAKAGFRCARPVE